MPLDFTTAQARTYLKQGVEEKDPVLKEKLREIMRLHMAERKEADQHPFRETPQELQERWASNKQVFSGLENYRNPSINPNPVEPNDNGAQRRFAATSNIGYLSQVQNMDPEEVAGIYPTLRKQYSQDVFGAKDDPGDEGLYSLIKGSIDRGSKIMDNQVTAQGQAFMKSLNTKVGAHWTSAYSEFRTENPTMFDGKDKEAERMVMESFRQSWKDANANTKTHREVANNLVQELQVKKDEEGNEIRPGLTDKTIQRLLNASKEDREVVYAIVRGEVKDGVLETSAWEDLKTSLGRGFSMHMGEGGSASRMLHGDRMRVLGKALASGEPVSVMVGQEATLANLHRTKAKPDAFVKSRALTPKERKDLTEQAELGEKYVTLLHELQNLDQQVLNPVTPSGFITRKIVYPAAEMPGFMVSNMIGVSVLGIQEDRYRELLDRGVPKDKARGMALISAAVEIPLEYLQIGNAMQGVKALRDIVNGTSVAKVALKHLGIGIGVQNAQEAAQDATNLLIQEVGSRVFEDVEGPTGEAWKEYLGSRADTFWALLPFPMFGAGVSTYAHFKNGEKFLQDRDGLVASGSKLERATEIAEVAQESPDKAEKMLREDYENGKVGKPDPEAMDRAMAEMEESMEGMTINKDTKEVTLTDEATGNTVTFPDMDAALEGRLDSREASAKDNIRAIAAIQKRFENRGQVEFATDRKKAETLQTKIDAEIITKEEAQQRVQDIALELGHSKDHYAGVPFDKFPIHAESRFDELTGRYIVAMKEGGGVRAAMEDSAETIFKNWDIEGYRTIEQYREWIGQFQKINKEKFHLIPEADLATASKKSIIEAMSSLAVGFASNKTADYQFDSVVTRILHQLAELWRHATERGALLISQFEAGLLDTDFETAVSAAAGLDAPTREKTKRKAKTVLVAKFRSELAKAVKKDIDANENPLVEADIRAFLDAIIDADKVKAPEGMTDQDLLDLMNAVVMSAVSPNRVGPSFSIGFLRDINRVTDTKEALDVVHTHGDPQQKALARVISRAVPDGIPFQYVDNIDYIWPSGKKAKPGTILGLYTPSFGVQARRIQVANSFPVSAQIETILHESIHAGTQTAIFNYRHYPESLTKDQIDAIKTLETIRKSFLDWGVAEDMAKLGPGAVADTGYVFSSIEFPAWVLLNEEMAARFGIVMGDDLQFTRRRLKQLQEGGFMSQSAHDQLRKFVEMRAHLEKSNPGRFQSLLDFVIDLIRRTVGLGERPDLNAAFAASMELLKVQAETLKAESEVGSTFAIGRPDVEALLTKASFIKGFSEKATRHVLGKIETLDEKWSEVVRKAAAKGKLPADTTEVTQLLRQLDALMFLIPMSLRAKVGGHTALSQKRKDPTKAKALGLKILAMERVLKDYLKKKDIKQIKREADAAKPKKGKSKAGPLAAEFARQVSKVVRLGPTKVNDRLSELKKFFENPPENTTEATINEAEEEQLMLKKYGALTKASYEHVLAARMDLTELIETGVAERSAREAKRLKAQEDSRQALVKQVGSSGSETQARIKEKEQERKKIRTFLRDHVDEHLSFRQDLVRAFGRYTGVVKEMVNRARQSTTKYTDRIIHEQEHFAEEMARIWGIEGKPDSLKVKRKVRKILHRLHTDVKTDIFFDGEVQELNEAEAINYTLIFGQPRYESNLAKIGYSAETNEQVEAMLSEEAIQLRQWLLDKYRAEHSRLNAVYERLTGARLPMEKNYAPVEFTVEGEGEIMRDPFQNSVDMDGFAAGFLRDRVEHQEPPRRASALATYWAHTTKAEYYISWAETVQYLRSILTHKDIQTSVMSSSGRNMNTLLQKWVSIFANNGNKKAEAFHGSDRMIRNLKRAQALAGLSWNISSLMKQAPALVGFGASGLTAQESITSSIRVLLTMPFNNKVLEAWRSEAIQRRLKSGHSVEQRMALDANGIPPGMILQMLELGIKPLGHLDAGLTSFSAAVIRDAYTRRPEFKRAGANSPEVQAQILRDAVTEAVNNTAQPVELMDRSIFEISNMDGWGAFMLMFRSEPRQKLALMLMAYEGLKKKEDINANLTTIFTVMVIMPSMMVVMQEHFRNLFRGDDEELELDDFLLAWLTGPFAGFSHLGSAIDVGLALSFGEKAFLRSENSTATATADFVMAINKAVANFKADQDFDFPGAGKAIAKALSVGGMVYPEASVGVVGVRVAEYIGDNAWTNYSGKVEEAGKVTKKAKDELAKEMRLEMNDLEYTIDKYTKVGDGSRAILIKKSLDRIEDEEERDLLRKKWIDMKLLSTRVAKQIEELK